MNTSLVFFENPIWTPLKLTNSMIFVSADNSYNLNNINNPTMWYDLSGNNNNLNLIDGVISYDSNLKNIRFGENNSLSKLSIGKPLLTINYNNSFFIGLRSISNLTNSHIIGQSSTTSSKQYRIGTNNLNRYTFSSTNPNLSYTDSNDYYSTFQLLNIDCHDTFNYFINTIQYGNQVISIATPSTLHFTVGADTGNNRFFNGYIEFILITNTIISNTNKQKIEGWWAHTFNHLNLLPINHPYKTNYPT